MPNLDGGHYFFTAAVPVCNDGIVERPSIDGTGPPIRSSPIHLVREALETLPTALQSHAAERCGIQSPFARSLRTHFARFVVLDQPNYNGRDPQNAVIEAISSVDLLKPQPQDALACPYILVAIDFDPATPDARGEPRAYLEELWTLMPRELGAVFAYCYGFRDVVDAGTFADFLLPCQIETVMSFNDYYTGAPPLKSASKLLLLAPALLLVPIVARWCTPWAGWGVAVLAALLLLVLGLLFDYAYMMRFGNRPFPANPDATLPHILKALYLQQAFTRLAAAGQGGTLAERGAAFRTFLEESRPAVLTGPTQPPGVVRSPLAEAR